MQCHWWCYRVMLGEIMDVMSGRVVIIIISCITASIACTWSIFMVTGSGYQLSHNSFWLADTGELINTLRPRQDGRHFPDHIFRCIFLNENIWIAINISLSFVPKGSIDNIPALVQIMAWRFFPDTYLTIEVQGIQCTHHLLDSCPLTDVNPHITAPGCDSISKLTADGLLWRHRHMGQPLAIVTSQWSIVPTGIYGRMMLRSTWVKGIVSTGRERWLGSGGWKVEIIQTINS